MCTANIASERTSLCIAECKMIVQLDQDYDVLSAKVQIELYLQDRILQEFSV